MGFGALISVKYLFVGIIAKNNFHVRLSKGYERNKDSDRAKQV